jgi:hypothetical protein
MTEALPVQNRKISAGGFMTIGTAREYQNMSPEDQRKFDRWLQSNAFFGSIFAIGMLAMAFAAIVVPYELNKDKAAVVPTAITGEKNIRSAVPPTKLAHKPGAQARH